MNGYLTLLERSFFGARALNPLERLDAARGWAANPSGGWLATLVLVVVLLAAVAALGAMLYRRWQLERHRRKVFNQRCQRAGLTERERYVMLAIAKVVKLPSPEVLFSAGDVFEGALGKLRRSARITSLSEERRRDIDELIESLRSRLGFRRPSQWQSGPDAPPGEGVEDLAAGDELTVVRPGKTDTLDVSVVEAGPDELTVRADAPLDCKPGETWQVRYSREGKLLEFDAPVLEGRQKRVRLGRPGAARLVNRRKFPRVATSKPVRVARLPFLTSQMGQLPSEFVSGELVEIAGTGLRLKAPVDVRRGERVLLTMEFAKDDVIEAVGKVTRAVKDEDGGSVLIVELLGLSEEEIAKLTRETNAAVLKSARQQEDQRQAPQWRASTEAAGQQARQED